jgi:hypothetical protein
MDGKKPMQLVSYPNECEAMKFRSPQGALLRATDLSYKASACSVIHFT